MVEYLLIATGWLIANKKTRSEALFQRENALLDGVDQILACWNDHPDLTFARFRLKYYRVLVYMTQHEEAVNAIGAGLQEVVTFHCSRAD